MKTTGTEDIDLGELLCSKLGLIKRFLVYFNVPSEYRDDLIQEIFLTAIHGIGKVRDLDKLNSWLYKVSYRKMIHYVNKERMIKGLEIPFTQMSKEDEEAFEKRNYIIWDILDRIVDNQQLYAFISRLKPSAQEILKLRFGYGFTLKEIAEMKQMNYNTVKTIEHRSLQFLKKCIREGERAE